MGREQLLKQQHDRTVLFGLFGSEGLKAYEIRVVCQRQKLFIICFHYVVCRVALPFRRNVRTFTAGPSVGFPDSTVCNCRMAANVKEPMNECKPSADWPYRCIIRKDKKHLSSSSVAGFTFRGGSSHRTWPDFSRNRFATLQIRLRLP